MATPPTASRIAGAALAWLMAALLVAAANAASSAVPGPLGFSPWNIVVGISAGLVMVAGLRMIPAVLAGQVLGAWAIGWTTAVGKGAMGSVVCALVAIAAGLWLRRVIPRDPGAWSVRDVVMLIVTAVVLGIVAAGCVWLHVQMGDPRPIRFEQYFAATVGAATGLVLGAPAVASAMRLSREGTMRVLRELPAASVMVHVILTLGAGAVAFLLTGPTGERFWSLYFIPMLWTSFCFGMYGMVGALALISLQAIVLAMLVGTPFTTLSNYHFFLFNFTAVALLLAAALGARHAAERAKGRSEALLAGAFRIMHDAFVLVRSGDGAMLDMNDAWVRLVGRSRESLLGESMFSLPVWLGDAGPRLEQLVRSGVPVHEFVAELRQPAGTTRAVQVIVELVPYGREIYGVAFVRDVTESRMIERQRLQSQKLEAVGLLAGGVAHDFNNILTVITTAGELLKEATPPGDQRHADAESILDAAQRGAQLTRQLLAFSRQREDAPPRACDVAVTITDMLGMLRRLLGAGVDVRTRLEPGISVVASPGQLEQVILNLSINARDAMDGSGTLELTSALRVIPQAMIVPEVAGMVAPGRWVVLTARDTGEGIDPGLQARIFEPFFTTKPEGKGTGLGLSTVYGIIQGVGGHVGVQSALGEGTTFVLYWPAA